MKPLKAFLQALVSFAGLVYLTAGCAANVDTGALPTPTHILAAPAQRSSLDGTRWELMAFESETQTPVIPEKPRFFISFSGGELSLQGGCNTVSGQYQVENNRITMRFVEATLTDCADSMPGVNEVEDAFSAIMPTFERYVLDGDRLLIYYPGGVLRFRRLPE